MPSAPAVDEKVHVTKNGETLTVIAKKWGVTVAALRAANPNLKSGKLRVGLRLKFPKNILPPGPKTLAEFVTGKTLLLIRGDTNPVEHFHFTFVDEATVLNGLGEEATCKVSGLAMRIIPSRGEQKIQLLFPAPILNTGDTIKLSRENKETDPEELVVTGILTRDESSPLSSERDGFSSAGYFYQEILRQLKQPNRIWAQSDFGRVSELSESLTENDRSVAYPFTNLKALTRFHNLEKLGIEWSALTDLSPLVGFPKLRELEINVHEAKSLAPLAQLKQLRSLHLLNDNPDRPQAEIAALKNALPKCTIKREVGKKKKVRPVLSEAEESAGIINAAIRKALSKPFRKLTASDLQEITSLDLARLKLTHLDALEKLTHLKKLDLGENRISDLAPLRALKRLRLNGNQVAGLTPLAGIKTLQAVYLHKYPLSDLKPLIGMHTHMADKLNGNRALMSKQVARLQKELPDCLIVFNRPTSPAVGQKAEAIIEAAIRRAIDKPTGNLTIVDFNKVKKLMLVCENLADISVLNKLKNMELLCLYGNQVADLGPLADLENLKIVDLRGNQVTDLSPLQDLANLNALLLENNKVSDLRPLLGLNRLVVLDLANNRVTRLNRWRNHREDWLQPTPLPRLSFVQMRGNPKTKAIEVWRLLSARPGLRIPLSKDLPSDWWPYHDSTEESNLQSYHDTTPELPWGDLKFNPNIHSRRIQNVEIGLDAPEYDIEGASFPLMINGNNVESMRAINDWMAKHFRKTTVKYTLGLGPGEKVESVGYPSDLEWRGSAYHPPFHVFGAYMHRPMGNVFSATVTDHNTHYNGTPRVRQNGINLWQKDGRVEEIRLPDLFKPGSDWEKAVAHSILKRATRIYLRMEKARPYPFHLDEVPRDINEYKGKFWIMPKGLGFYFTPTSQYRGIWGFGMNVTVPMKFLQPYLRKDGPLGHLAKKPE